MKKTEALKFLSDILNWHGFISDDTNNKIQSIKDKHKNTKMFFSVKTKAEATKLKNQIIQALKLYRLPANIENITSVVKNKDTNLFYTEYGFKVTLLDDTDIQTIILMFFNIRRATSIYCIWLDHKDYHGCILKHPYYLENYKFYTEKQLSCSEYD